MYSFQIVVRTASETGVGGLKEGFKGNGYTTMSIVYGIQRIEQDELNYLTTKPVLRSMWVLVLDTLRSKPLSVSWTLREWILRTTFRLGRVLSTRSKSEP